MQNQIDINAADNSALLAKKTREHLVKRGVKSPNVSNMLAFRVDSKTVFYADSPEKLEHIVKKYSQRPKNYR